MSNQKQIATLLFNMGLNQKVDPVSAELGYVEKLINFKFVKDGRVDTFRPLVNYQIPFDDIGRNPIRYLQTVSDVELMTVLADGRAAFFKKVADPTSATLMCGPRPPNSIAPVLTDRAVNLYWQSTQEEIEREHSAIEVASYDADDCWSASCWLVRRSSFGTEVLYDLKYKIRDKINERVHTEAEFADDPYTIGLCSK